MSRCEHGFELIGARETCPECETTTQMAALEAENTRLKAAVESLGAQVCEFADTNPLNETVIELERARDALEAENRVARELVEDALDFLWVRDKEYYQRIHVRCTWITGEVEVDRSHDGRDELLARIAALTREYQDYMTIAEHCTAVYSHFSGGRISKPFTLPSEVIAQAEAIQQDDFQTWHKERLEPIKERLLEFGERWYEDLGGDAARELRDHLAAWIEETFKETP